jgi:hypothetical protein
MLTDKKIGAILLIIKVLGKKKEKKCKYGTNKINIST